MAKGVSDADEGLSPREARKLARLEQGRKEILDTAEYLFSRRGYHGTALKDVAESCEFSVGFIYTYFASKDDLYAAVVDRYGSDEIPEMLKAVQGEGTALERLLKLAELQVNYFRRYPGWGRLMTRIMTPALQLDDDAPNPGQRGFTEGYGQAIKVEADLIKSGQNDGTVRSGDPIALARMFSALVTSFHVSDFDDSHDEGPPDLDAFIAFLRDTYAPRTP